jgi:hypothetical protein
MRWVDLDNWPLASDQPLDDGDDEVGDDGDGDDDDEEATKKHDADWVDET